MRKLLTYNPRRRGSRPLKDRQAQKTLFRSDNSVSMVFVYSKEVFFVDQQGQVELRAPLLLVTGVVLKGGYYRFKPKTKGVFVFVGTLAVLGVSVDAVEKEIREDQEYCLFNYGQDYASFTFTPSR